MPFHIGYWSNSRLGSPHDPLLKEGSGLGLVGRGASLPNPT
jgi:hypothetical protein